MRFSILQILILIVIVAVQVQSPLMIVVGFYLTLVLGFCTMLLLFVSALFSESKGGQLDVMTNPIFRVCRIVFIWCVINGFISVVLLRTVP